MLGPTRINMLTPAGCVGKWHHDAALPEVFGFTVHDPDGGPFALGGIWVMITSALGVTTAENVFVDALPLTWTWPTAFPIVQPHPVNPPGVPAVPVAPLFDADWAGPASSYDPVTGVCLVEKTLAYGAGDLVQFMVLTHDGLGHTTVSSWVVGMGDPPGHDAIRVGSLVKSLDGKRWKVEELVGAPGAVRYSCVCNDRTICGRPHFASGDIEVFGPRDRLDDRVVLAE